MGVVVVVVLFYVSVSCVVVVCMRVVFLFRDVHCLVNLIYVLV